VNTYILGDTIQDSINIVIGNARRLKSDCVLFHNSQAYSGMNLTAVKRKAAHNKQKYFLACYKIALYQGQLSLKCVGRKIWSDISKNLKALSPYSCGKQYKNILLSCQNSCWFSFYMFVTFCNIVLMPLFYLLLSFASTTAHPTRCSSACFSPTVFCLFYLTLVWCILLLFYHL